MNRRVVTGLILKALPAPLVILRKKLLKASGDIKMKYYHVDVFSNKPYSGNGLTIFTDAKPLEKSTMQTITQEMRQFESVFLHQIDSNTFRASIFTMEEELDFAGH